MHLSFGCFKKSAVRQRSQPTEGLIQPLDNTAEEGQVQGLHRVAQPVVIRISQKRGIRDHQGAVALVPERAVVSEARLGTVTTLLGNGNDLGLDLLAHRATLAREHQPR